MYTAQHTELALRCYINGVLVATLGFDCPGAEAARSAQWGRAYWHRSHTTDEIDVT